MSEPVIAARAPIAVDVEEGKAYFWCACGRSARQPFCDGSHRDTGFEPVRYDATKTCTLYFCACKRTNRKPLCDGSHNTL